MAFVVLFPLLIGAVVTDLWRHKIYNCWVLCGLLTGLALAGATENSAGLIRGLVSMLLALFLLFPVYLIGGIGAGDVKLFAAAAVNLTPEEVLLGILLSFLIGAVFSVVRILRTGSLRGQTIHFAIPVLISVLFIYGGKL